MNTVLKTIAIVSALAAAQPAFSFPTELRPSGEQWTRPFAEPVLVRRRAVVRPRVVRPRPNVVIRRNVVVRPVRRWVRRPYFGTIVAGVALGTIVAVAAASVSPPAPSPDLCWFWSSSSKTKGYWDYCVPR